MKKLVSGLVTVVTQIALLVLSSFLLFLLCEFNWLIFKYFELQGAGLWLLMLVPLILWSFSLALIPANSVFKFWFLTIKSLFKRNAK